MIAKKEKGYLCKILDNGLMGQIYNYNLNDKQQQYNSIEVDSILKARVYEINYETRSLNLTIK